MSSEATNTEAAASRFKTAGKFCERHGLISELVPFAHRTIDPWETVERLAREIDRLPNTAATFEFSDLYREYDDQLRHSERPGVVHLGLTLLGAWPQNASRRSSPRWVNPNYAHERALAPADVDRLEHLRTCADLGVFRQSDLASRFGIDTRSLQWWVRHNEIDWLERRRVGQRQMGRTLAVASDWTGRTLRSLIEPLPMQYEPVRYWVRQTVNESEWSVPDDPSLVGGVDS